MAKLNLNLKTLWFAAIQALKVRFWLRFDLDLLTSKGFVTWHRRPKKLSQWTGKMQQSMPVSNFGLVIQGPIVYKHHFTLESARLYRSLYPTMPIVICTWAGVREEFLQDCQKIDVQVIQSPSIRSPHYGNLNRQQVTTLSGLNWLQSSGIRYSLKTRTDQRLFAVNFAHYFQNLDRLFPPIEITNRISKSRIFITYQNSFMDRHLSGSDFLHFGETQDLIQLWSSIDTKILPTNLAPEQILLGSYLIDIGWKSDALFTEKAWAESMEKVVGFVDSSAIDLFWLKYSSREYLWRRYGNEPMREVTPADWYSKLTNAR